jgi:hypothetical protein
MIAQLNMCVFKEQVVIAQLGKASSETSFQVSGFGVEKRVGILRMHAIGKCIESWINSSLELELTTWIDINAACFLSKHPTELFWVTYC